MKNGNGRSVAVFGAGIAGLTVAHELSRRGYNVSVYEANTEAGGFFRSARRPADDNTPSEYSWHGMGPWYHNAYDVLRQIPFDPTGSIYDKGLSRPIDFGIFPEIGAAAFYDHGLRSIRRMFGLSQGEFIKGAWLMLKTWSANHRTEQVYSRLNAASAWDAVLTPRGGRRWRSCFGPWIGSDWTRVSLHHAGQFFRKQLISRPRHIHSADRNGPAWSHGAGNGWLLFSGPSSEIWFDRWVSYLGGLGVRFYWSQPLTQLHLQNDRITKATLSTGDQVEADAYVLAINPFVAAEIVALTPELETKEELRLFRPLVSDGAHVQVSFRVAFGERIRFPREREAMILADSEFNLTLFAQEQAWTSDVELGTGVKSLWTGTSCAATVPGRIHGRPVINCTQQQFIEEIMSQLTNCAALNAELQRANAGRALRDFGILKIEVWHEWLFSVDGIKSPQPKWVNTTRTQPFMPRQRTPVENLFLAGAHTKTEADVWSIEAAVESGRRAAQGIDPAVKVISQYKPVWLRVLSWLDDLSFRCRGPHVLEIALYTSLVLTAVAVTALILR